METVKLPELPSVIGITQDWNPFAAFRRVALEHDDIRRYVEKHTLPGKRVLWWPSLLDRRNIQYFYDAALPVTDAVPARVLECRDDGYYVLEVKGINFTFKAYAGRREFEVVYAPVRRIR